MHRLYFLFARDLTPPLFRIECQLEDLTPLHYVVCVVVSRKKKEKRTSIEQALRDCWHAFTRDSDREKRDASSVGEVKVRSKRTRVKENPFVIQVRDDYSRFSSL